MLHFPQKGMHWKHARQITLNQLLYAKHQKHARGSDSSASVAARKEDDLLTDGDGMHLPS